jgi:hypothetical protein
MTPRRITTLRRDEELAEGLRLIWDRDGRSASEQTRRAIRAWLESKGVKVKTAKPARAKRAGKA